MAVNDLTITGSGSSGTGVSVSAGTATLYQDTISGYTTGLDVNGGSIASATQNLITGNTVGVSVDSGAGSVSLTGNSIHGNANAGLVNNSSNAVTATGNWWGNANGPTTPLNQYAATLGLSSANTGDVVSGSGMPTLAPWLNDGTDSAANTPGFQHAGPNTSAPVFSGQTSQNATEGQSQSFTLGSATDSSPMAVDVSWDDGARTRSSRWAPVRQPRSVRSRIRTASTEVTLRRLKLWTRPAMLPQRISVLPWRTLC